VNGELDLLIREEAIKPETGSGATVEGSSPLLEDRAETHGLQDAVKPWQRHTVIGLEKV
jgi:hypothetical protein